MVDSHVPSKTWFQRQAVIKNADMAEDMQQDAIDCATQALEKCAFRRGGGRPPGGVTHFPGRFW